jgi:hypothetical protein
MASEPTVKSQIKNLVHPDENRDTKISWMPFFNGMNNMSLYKKSIPAEAGIQDTMNTTKEALSGIVRQAKDYISRFVYNSTSVISRVCSESA